VVCSGRYHLFQLTVTGAYDRKASHVNKLIFALTLLMSSDRIQIYNNKRYVYQHKQLLDISLIHIFFSI